MGERYALRIVYVNAHMLYNAAHGESGATNFSGATFPGVGGRYATAAAELNCGPRNLRVLLRGDPAREPAKGFPAPGVPAPCGDSGHPARWKVDALPARRSQRSSSGRDFTCDLAALARKTADATRHQPSELRVLFAKKVRHSTGCTLTCASFRSQGSVGTQVVKVFDLAIAPTGLRETEARDAGFNPFTTEVKVWNHKAYYPGARELRMRVTGGRRS
jgi:hypothetical protein